MVLLQDFCYIPINVPVISIGISIVFLYQLLTIYVDPSPLKAQLRLPLVPLSQRTLSSAAVESSLVSPALTQTGSPWSLQERFQRKINQSIDYIEL